MLHLVLVARRLPKKFLERLALVLILPKRTWSFV
jgi:hypothetical protein